MLESPSRIPVTAGDDELAAFATDEWVANLALIEQQVTISTGEISVAAVLTGAVRHARAARNSPAWCRGVEDALSSVRAKLAVMPDLQVAAYRTALLEIENSLLAILQNGGPLTSEVMESEPIKIEVDPDGWDGCWGAFSSCPDEEFSMPEPYSSRQDAINAAAEDLGLPDGDTFWTAVMDLRVELPEMPYDAEGMLDQLADNMSSDWHESAIENFVSEATPHLPELDRELNATWDAWVKRHKLELHGYTAEQMEQHTVGEDEDEETLKERAERDAKEPPG